MFDSFKVHELRDLHFDFSWLALVIYARLDITQFPNIIRENLY